MNIEKLSWNSDFFNLLIESANIVSKEDGKI